MTGFTPVKSISHFTSSTPKSGEFVINTIYLLEKKPPLDWAAFSVEIIFTFQPVKDYEVLIQATKQIVFWLVVLNLMVLLAGLLKVPYPAPT